MATKRNWQHTQQSSIEAPVDHHRTSSFYYASMLMDQEKTGVVSLSLSQKGKLIWTLSFEVLQSFVREALNLSNGFWSSPGGYGKLYQGKDVALRWYSDTKSIILSGKLAKEFEEKLNSMASISQDLANDIQGPSKSDTNSYQGKMRISIRKLRMKSSPVLIQESKNETDCLKEKNYQLMDENKHLKSEKNDLTERINNLSYILADLQQKTKNAEQERDSVITAMRLLIGEHPVKRYCKPGY